MESTEPVVVPLKNTGHPLVGMRPPSVAGVNPSGEPAYPPMNIDAEPPPPPATANMRLTGLVNHTADAPPPDAV